MIHWLQIKPNPFFFVFFLHLSKKLPKRVDWRKGGSRALQWQGCTNTTIIKGRDDDKWRSKGGTSLLDRQTTQSESTNIPTMGLAWLSSVECLLTSLMVFLSQSFKPLFSDLLVQIIKMDLVLVHKRTVM